MENFVKSLTKEQLELLENIKPDFREMETGDLWEWLTDYMQTHGINDIDNRPDLKMIDQIIDMTTEY